MMRTRLLTIALAAGLAAAAVIGLSRRPAETKNAAAVPLLPSPEANPAGELKTTADREAIFKRAFWRRPEREDRIVHADLSEWSEEGDVSRWQWFIEVEPSDSLKSWLLQGNPFSLVPTEAKQLRASASTAPKWFPTSAQEFDIHQSSDGSLSLLFSRERKVLFATASGHGFAKGKSEPERPVVKIESNGRLPLTSPPDPRQP